MWDNRPDGRTLRDDFVNSDLYIQGVNEGWTEVELYRMLVRQLQRSFHAGSDADRRTLLANRPRLTGTKWDAVIASVVEHVALRHGYEPPEWVDEAERFLEAPVTALGVEYEVDFASQPGPFLRRGITIDARDLDWRTGDGRGWVPEY